MVELHLALAVGVNVSALLKAIAEIIALYGKEGSVKIDITFGSN